MTRKAADDPMETTTETKNETETKKKSKKEKKAKKEKLKRKRDDHNDNNKTGIEQRIEDINNDLVRNKKYDENENDADPSGPDAVLHNDDKKKKKKDKKKSKKRKKDKKKKKCLDDNKHSSDDASMEDDDSTDDPAAAASGGYGLVASSAIEFYDADLKKKAKKRQKLMTDNERTNNPGNESEFGPEGALEAQRLKSKSKKKKKDRHNEKDSDEREQLLEQQKKRDELEQEKKHNHSLTLLLFYQYIEPEWDDETYEKILRNLKKIGTSLELTGRMRVAKEGLNCTLTGTHESILEYTRAVRQLRPNDLKNTEFKLTTELPVAQKFGELKMLPVLEIVRYGLEGQKAPPIQQYSGVHLEPKDYHKKLAESNTVIIDVRNHYEAAIGRFVPPTEDTQDSKGQSSNSSDGPQWIDPKMRKSTEFPAWLDKDETKQMMKGKQVLMYCTGGIRCERASALLKYKMETDDTVKDLGIHGVFQLQGGIDKYFKEFPDGGYWKGKNYVFDKRFAHAPPKIDGELHGRTKDTNETKVPSNDDTSTTQLMGKCEACLKPWDMYRGKRRCPTCGVPSLICKDCFQADKKGTKKLGREIRCDLCVEQGIFTKRDYKEKDERFITDYESKMRTKGLLLPNAVGGGNSNSNNPDSGAPTVPNPKEITRLVLKNMCRKNMTEDALVEALPGITHIVWGTQRNRKNPSAEPIFTGMGWVEMATPEDASRAVAQSNQLKLFQRPMGIAFQPPDGKDVWPKSSSKVGY